MKTYFPSRVKDQNGLLFYEQDVLMLSPVYREDTHVTVTLDYHVTGIGLVYVPVSGNRYMSRIGQDMVSIYQRTAGGQNELLYASANIAPPIDNLSLVFKKTGSTLSVETADGDIIAYVPVPDNLDEYRIGVYSNAGNRIKNLNVRTGVPYSWRINIENVPGGRVGFRRDGFIMENFVLGVDMEHQEIDMPAGTYYLGYEKTGDIVPYVFNSDSPIKDADKKNLMGPDGVLVLTEDTKINVLFRGREGSVSNITLKENKNDPYVSSRESAIEVAGSQITITPANVLKVRLTGRVDHLPETTNQYGLLLTDIGSIKPADMSLTLAERFTMEVTPASQLITVQQGTKSAVTLNYGSISNKTAPVHLMANMNAVVSHLTITYAGGEEVDLIVQQTAKQYLPDTIKSPVIATDENRLPLDLSASYRWHLDGNHNRVYRFTNWEREWFDAAPMVRLNKPVRENSADYVRIYGIKTKGKRDRLLQNLVNGLDTIDAYTTAYDLLLLEQSDYDIPNGVINLNSYQQYKGFVIDYLKENSYAINHLFDKGQYEVDLSTSKDTVRLSYDYLSSDEASGSIPTHIVTHIVPDNNKYIVLSETH